jgi:DNA invertase Pin-like site-specific DNA recombinase
MTTTRALLYVRVSTSEQAASGLGLDAQETTLRAEAERRGWEVAAVPGGRGEREARHAQAGLPAGP